ncbi:exo-beta-N-acetylmuramidase NamZ family protein [Alteromonas sp. ASW11-130]|uniref:exo-beta-N-acetylmuramidase NamZ family protein n=1 Tax=Alteromonas sp. ASW11-130 TaxID=3015775 RepID=UPI002241F828|nr:DUF1343 domain-containing protein [Alteromonas sp. ASW11-130]MCW8090842.1 DUF1343 domain-containing protein [Alteromonas sp. ASW11-130]
MKNSGIGILLLLLLLLLLVSSWARAITVAAERPEQYLPLLKGKNVGVVVNHTSLVGERHLVNFLLSQNVNVSKIYSPEHGFKGQASAGEKIKDSVSPMNNLPLLSLYGETKKPTPSMLKNIDILVFDIQDVGARFYTYISTMHYVMEAAAEQGIPLIILDRPNPNGKYVDGPIRDSKQQSFVGMHPIPVLHGMTVGELALMIKGEQWIKQAEELILHVIPVADYNKTKPYPLPVPPSPNLPNDIAVSLYPSLCFFEATVVSVGRGTPYPFQLIGHDRVKLGHMSVTPISQPAAISPKLEGKRLFAQDLRQSPRQGLQLTYLIEAHRRFTKAGETFFDRPGFMDKLAGTHALREAIEQGLDEMTIRTSWQHDLDKFHQLREPYLLYPVQ